MSVNATSHGEPYKIFISKSDFPAHEERHKVLQRRDGEALHCPMEGQEQRNISGL